MFFEKEFPCKFPVTKPLSTVYENLVRESREDQVFQCYNMLYRDSHKLGFFVHKYVKNSLYWICT